MWQTLRPGLVWVGFVSLLAAVFNGLVETVVEATLKQLGIDPGVGPVISWLSNPVVAVAGWVAAASFGIVYWRTTFDRRNSPPTDVVEFYETREELSRHRPLMATLRSSQEVWALWIAGTVGWANDVCDSRTIKRLLLPNPHSPAFVLLASAVKRSPDDIANSIRGVTREAQKAGVEVRWFPTLPVSTVMIGEPEGESGWVQVEALFHATGAGERFCVRFARKTHPKAFRHVKQSFEAVWTAAEAPDKAEEREAFIRTVDASREQKSGLQRIAESAASQGHDRV
jgi:hypothetical protein